MGKGTAFGKSILIGDQFVLEEVPAIVSSIPFETECIVERLPEGSSWTLEDNRTEVPGYKEKKKHQQVDSINHMLEVMKIDVKKNPIKITYGGSLLAGSGVGASAAHCVSLARALNEEFSLGLSIDEINHFGWEGEFAYHGTPSGVDNTASTYGGLLLYHIKNGVKTWERINLKQPVEVVLGNSGVTADTSKLDAHTEAQRKKNPDLYAKRLQMITDQAFEMKKALEDYDLAAVGKLMTANHEILIEMDLSHDILIHLCNMALDMGALGAKVTGGGRGGYMNALTPGKELQDKIASAMEKEGYKVIRTTVGGC
jgi:mevalonate kinase